jgi:hypothetical protein
VSQYTVDVKAFQQSLVSMVEQCRLDPAEVAFALLPDILDSEARPDGIAHNGWL